MGRIFRIPKITRAVRHGIGALLLLAFGCGGFRPNVTIPAAVKAGLYASVTTTKAQYRAYGDSITYGETLTASQRPYPAFVAEDEGVSYADNAIPGDQACDVPAMQIFPQQDFPTVASHPMYSLLIGTNDAFDGAGAYEKVFNLCDQAAISWLAIPAEFKVLANGSGATTTGAGMIDTSNNWNAWTTGESGASISFTITTIQPGPIYAWPRIIDGDPGTYSYSVDGQVVGSSTTATTPSIGTRNGGSNSLALLRLPTVAAGTHVVTFTQTNDGAPGISIVGIGTPTRPAADQFPTVLVGTIPFQEPGSACDTSSGACHSYNLDIEANVNLFAQDGLNVRLFDTRKYMFGSPAEMNDLAHPNEIGQFELSHAVEASWSPPLVP